jgi:hypothetical protein
MKFITGMNKNKIDFFFLEQVYFINSLEHTTHSGLKAYPEEY